MAEEIPRNMAGDRFEVFSASTHRAGLNPKAVGEMMLVWFARQSRRSLFWNCGRLRAFRGVRWEGRALKEATQ